jgi:hypothetical protein
MNEQPGTYFFQYVELVQDLRYSTFEQFQIPPKTYYVWEWLRVICSRSIIIIQRSSHNIDKESLHKKRSMNPNQMAFCMLQ